MASIVYSGEDVRSIKDDLSEYDIVYISEEDLLNKDAEVEQNIKNSELLILDAHIKKSIKILQVVSQIDKNLSVIIIKDPVELENFRIAIQFTPFIGSNFRIISSIQRDQLKNIAQDLTRLTCQRRSYQQLLAATNKMNLIDRAPDLHIAYLDKFLDEAPVGAVLLDEQDHIRALNKYAQDLLVINESDAYLSTIYQFFMTEELDKISELLSSEKTAINSRIATGKYVRATISEITGDKNYKILILYDITPRILVEQELQKKMEELERSNRELEQFAYIVSHDLKNPIGSMMITTELAAGEKDMEVMKDHIDRLKRSSNQLMDIVKGLEELIDVQKNVDAHVHPINFEDVFNAMIYDHEKQLKEIKAEIETDFSEVPSIQYIQPYINSIFSNLISNSIKYRKEDVPLKLKIYTERDGNLVKLHFRDNGIGMNLDQHKDDIFKPFRRFTSQAQGKGIGLSIIRQMISRNGGQIEVLSTEGEGTEFICYLKPYAMSGIDGSSTIT